MKKGKAQKPVRQRNFVQAHVQQFCKPQVFENERDKMRRGYVKHKKGYVPSEWDFGLRAA